MSLAPLGGCRAPEARARAAAERPADEVWLTDAQVTAMELAVGEVTLRDVDRTVMAVGPVVPPAECPVSPGAREACALVAVDQALLGDVRLGTPAVGRTSDTMHDVFAGRVGWIAGTLDRTGRTVNLGCLFPDRLGELREGRQLRTDVVVGTRPGFAVERSAVVTSREGAYVFVPHGATEDGRHRFARTRVRPLADGGGAWVQVEDLKPGSPVVNRGADALASMLAATAL
ncbi:MAG TPA: efflux RND transporter periplasmic adaptor subunit [Polyangiaceae bacterium]|jgi:hypothetical protein